MKSTILLTTALFLASAPSPDSRTISELSAGFFVQNTERGLMASESVPKTAADAVESAQFNTPLAQAGGGSADPKSSSASPQREQTLTN